MVGAATAKTKRGSAKVREDSPPRKVRRVLERSPQLERVIAREAARAKRLEEQSESEQEREAARAKRLEEQNLILEQEREAARAKRLEEQNRILEQEQEAARTKRLEEQKRILEEEQAKGRSFCLRAPIKLREYGKGKGKGGPPLRATKLTTKAEEDVELEGRAEEKRYKPRGSTGRLSSEMYEAVNIVSSESDDEDEEDDASSWQVQLSVFEKLAGKKIDVKGDGFCWLYAILASMNLLESPSTPTVRDYKIASAFIRQMKTFVNAGGCAWLTKAEVKKLMGMDEPPVRELDVENYGGGALLYRVIACFLGTSIYTVEARYLQANMELTTGRKQEIVTASTVHGGYVMYNGTGRAGR